MAKRAIPPLSGIEVHSVLNDGTAVCLRTIARDDEPLLRAAIGALSAESRYLRFFSPAPMPPDAVVEGLVDVDGHDHLAWGAICSECEGHPVIGAVHAVRRAPDEPIGEYSVAVIDAFQGQGLARMMSAALLIQCLDEALAELDVHILSENRAASRLARALGARWMRETAGVAEYRLDVATGVDLLRRDHGARGVQDVFRALEGDAA